MNEAIYTSSRWTVLAILLSVTLLGIKGFGMLTAGAREPDQGQERMTGPAKTAEEYRALIQHLSAAGAVSAL